MRKGFLTSILLAFSMMLLNCGNDFHNPSNNIQPPTQTANIAFMQEIPGQPYVFAPMLGKFSVSGGSEQFTVTPIKDPSNGQPVAAEFYSITLGRDGKKAAIDLYGGLDGNSGQSDIWVGNVADASMVQISNDAYNDYLPQLSPDGTKVVYTSFRPGGAHTVIRNADGSGGEQILPLPEGFSNEFAPTFSPDSRGILVEANGLMWDGSKYVEFDGIWNMSADGTNLLMLTNAASECNCADRTPAFNGDGMNMAFSRVNYDTMTEDIYLIGALDIVKVTDGVGINHDPMFVKVGDKEKLLFSSNRDNLTLGASGFELYSMNTDGTGLTRLTDDPLFDAFSGWWYEIGSNPAGQPLNQRGLYQQHHTRSLRW